MSAEQLIKRYRSRITHGPLAPDPDLPAIASPPSPQPEPVPALPAAIISNAPVEAVEETGEKLEPITGEPEAAEPERTPPPANVVTLMTPELVRRSASLAASRCGNQGGPHQGNPEAGRPIDPAEGIAQAMRHPAAPRLSGTFDELK
jgi:hypothetical protein